MSPAISEATQQALFLAYDLAVEAHQDVVDVTELLLATVRVSPPLQEILYDLNIDATKLANVIEWVRIRARLRRAYLKFRVSASYRSKDGMDRAMTAVATPFLNAFSQDTTLAAKFGHLQPCVARDKEIEEIFRIIEGGRQNVLLVGNSGVGKMSIIEGLPSGWSKNACRKNCATNAWFSFRRPRFWPAPRCRGQRIGYFG